MDPDLSESASGDPNEEPDEPKLSYERVLNDVSEIIKTDSITSSCIHSKFFALGTLYGRIHVFDHQGNKVNRQELCVHLKAVNCIDIDEKGEYIVSCSNDRLVIFGLCNSEHNYVDMPDKPINVVAIDPSFYKAGVGRRFVAGDDRVILYERGFLARYKTTVLQSKEQKVRTISWHGQFIAWATDYSVQVFDTEQRTIITRIKREPDVDSDRYPEPCHFSWKDKRTFLIGWGCSVKVCLIKERSHEVLNETQLKELPWKYVEIISMFDTEFTISGLAPFGNSLLTLSIHKPQQDGDQRSRRPSTTTQSSCNLSIASTRSSATSFTTSLSTSQSNPSHSMISESATSDVASNTDTSRMIRPQIHILETFSDSYTEISKDILTPNSCLTLPSSPSKHNKTNKNKNHCSNPTPYSLLSIHTDGIYFIICPKDIISAKPRDYDDHIDWLIQHNMLEECCSFAREYSSELSRHTVGEVEELYKQNLFSKGTTESYKEAAKLCSSLCGNNQNQWNKVIKEFCELDQSKHLLPYLPKSFNGFHLNEETYNFILYDFLKNDSVSFFKAIKEIPCQLYNVNAMTDCVIRNLANDPKNLVLNEALAELYTRMGKFEDAVNIYLDYNDKTRIFSLIRNNNLVSILRDRVDRLMQIDAEETSQLLVENLDSIPMKDIVERLERYKSERFLVSYLHRLVLKDPDSCVEYHDMMVKLYAIHQRDSLLNFLKLSTHYRLEEALEICKEANLIKEVVFLHGRMGDLRIALRYIIESQESITEAIDFCKEHQDPELWQDLIMYSMDRPELIGPLLENIGTHINDPIELIDRLPVGRKIEGLMPALVKILHDYQLQITLEQSCRDLMAEDCLGLLQKQIRCQTQGISIREDQLCDHCSQPLMSEAVLKAVESMDNGLDLGETSWRSNLGVANDLVVFGCHHVFHEECCGIVDPDTANKAFTCRTCMIEKGADEGGKL